MDNDNGGPGPAARLPAAARLPINRCNLPADILGSLTFQDHPAPLLLDGVHELHAALFEGLDTLAEPVARARRFADYMVVHFRLEALEDAGLEPGRRKRGRADYLRTLRGWSFDPDGREGAALKGWVESRFGLLTRHHGEPVTDAAGDAYRRFLEARSAGLYNTNALEAQLDLLYTFCQYELARRLPGRSHLTLYRGVNRLEAHEVLARTGRGGRVVLLNNLNSFTGERDRADEFGDYILHCRVPLAKVFCFSRLLPGRLRGEDEFMVVGGLYAVTLHTL